MNTYYKLKDGNWGIKSTEKVSVGDSVIVTKKSGDTKEETIKSIVFSKDGITLCSIVHRNGCSCSESGCCRPTCRCDTSCNCRGGYIYDC